MFNMQIHVVKPGDSIYKIARMYNIAPNVLIDTNEIPNPNSLVPGQTIVIPVWGSYYQVEPGTTLYQVSNETGVPISEIARINNIQNPAALIPGTRLYIPQLPKVPIYTGGYVDTSITGNRSKEVVEEVGELLSTIQIFSYKVNSLGELIPPAQEEAVINEAYNSDILPIMVITNIEDGQFDTEVATAIFSDEALQEKVLDEVINIMNEKGYKGLDVDFEYLGAENREGYNAFMLKARQKLDQFGYILSSALAPKYRDDQKGVLYEGHDYNFHGKITDFVFIMTYEWGWTGGEPRAVAPLNEVKKVMDYAITQIPKDKIMMGIPLYGYDWTLPYVKGESRAKSISSNEAIIIADQYGAVIQYDEEAQSPFFYYTDEEGKEHEVWFEDARSIQAKFDLVKELGIRGFFYWVLGRKFPQNWLLLDDNFYPINY